MKKTTIYILLFLVCCMTGCNRENNSAKENALFSSAKEESNVITEENVVGKKVGAETKTDEILPEYNAFNRLLYGAERESFFCIASDTGILYFVNQCQDGFIYCLRDGVAELAVSLPAKELYYRQGILYFIVDNYEKYTLEGVQNGDIFAYNPAEGTVELVYSMGKLCDSASHLFVDENGIYVKGYAEGGEIEIDGEMLTYYEMECYMLDFENPEPVKDEGQRALIVLGYGEYHLGYQEHEGITTQVLISNASNENGKKDVKKIGDSRIISCCLVEDKLYYVNGLRMIVLDLDTFEKEVYDCSNFYMEKYLVPEDTFKKSWQAFDCFTVTEDYYWCVMGITLFRIDRESKEIESYQLMDEDTTLRVERLYTDGKNVYALYTPNAGLGGGEEMVQLLLDEPDGWYEEGPIREHIVKVKKLIP